MNDKLLSSVEECATYFYIGEDQKAWDKFVEVLNGLESLTTCSVDSIKLAGIFQVIGKIDMLKKSMNYCQIADLLHFDIKKRIEEIEV